LDLTSSIGFSAQFVPDPLALVDIKILVLKRPEQKR
jgi:hypothetical protein